MAIGPGVRSWPRARIDWGSSWPARFRFRNWTAELPEVISVFVVAGGSDFLLHVGVLDTDALYAFVIDRLTERAEVADVNTSVVYEHLRRSVLEPFPHVAA